MVDTCDILRRTALFGSLHVETLQRVAAICLVRHTARRQYLFHEGESGTALFVQVTGSTQLYKTAPDGRRIVIKVVKPGELFGEVVLFEQRHYPVNAMALSTGMVFTLPRHQFACLLEDASFRSDFLASVMGKLRFLTEKIQYLTSHDVEDRLFLFLEEQYGRAGALTVSFSKKDVAAAIGTTPETLSRLLLRLRKEGRCTWSGRRVIIDPAVWEERSPQR